MKIIVGVDSSGYYESALAWLKALRFKQAEILLCHVAEPIRPPLVGVIAPFPEEVLIESAQAQEQSAQARLESARLELESAGLSAETVLLRGHAGTQILQFAEETGADLIALGGSSKSTLQAFFVGSVMRTLITHAGQSLLVAYEPPKNLETLTVMIATDHSDYNAHCLQKLVAFAPQGIRKIEIATAYELDEDTLKLLTRGNPALQQGGAEWIMEHLHERNRQVCEQLRPLGAGCGSVVVEGPTIPALREALRETAAELMIVGAKGHSLIERLSLGSVSYHFATAERVNLLILRA